MNPRRQLVLAIAGCVIGAGLALFAVSRTWAVLVTERPPPLGPVRQPRSGASLAGWLPALGLVALAGAVALPAIRRTGRLAVAVVLIVSGLGIGAGAVRAIIEGAAAGWPVLCALGGLAVAGAGGFAAARGRTWPAMGSRYERTAPIPQDARNDASLWDAIDRGEDPTR
jgi:Tryptophan-associated transmembrane protein (Trp_oprn_chp)